MPEGLSLTEYYNLIDEHEDQWFSEKDENGITRRNKILDEDELVLTEEEIRYIHNQGERLKIIFYLEDIPEAEWTEKRSQSDEISDFRY